MKVVEDEVAAVSVVQENVAFASADYLHPQMLEVVVVALAGAVAADEDSSFFFKYFSLIPLSCSCEEKNLNKQLRKRRDVANLF